MANTVIAIKKSATPAAQPSVLANGELAINYADGKLFYKHANGTILPFNTQGGNAFGTINANGTLVVAGTSEAVVSLIAGNNITITGDAINDTITINATSDSNVAKDAFDKANAANVLAFNTGIGANAFAAATIAGANVAVGTGANTYLLSVISGANTAVGTGANTVGSAAFNKANNALANTSGVSFAGNLNFPTGNVGIGTSLPTSNLHVIGNANVSSNIRIGGFISFDNNDFVRVNEPAANTLVFNTSSTERVRINASGNVGIGTTTPNTKLDVVGNITSSNTVFAIHFDNVSDLSFKENIQTINNSIQTLSQLNPVSFDWKNTKNKSYGLIAQEVEKILPTIVHQKPDGTKTINYIEIIAFLIQAIKEQQKQLEDINTHINNAE